MKETISALPTSIGVYCTLFEHVIMTIYVTTIFAKFLLSYRNHVIKVTFVLTNPFSIPGFDIV
jgi:hypothetical protein